MKFQIVYCESCLTTVCVPVDFIKKSASGDSEFVKDCRYTNSVIIYKRVRDCKCDSEHGAWWRDTRLRAGVKNEVEVDLDDKFEPEEDSRIERMDFVVGGIP